MAGDDQGPSWDVDRVPVHDCPELAGPVKMQAAKEESIPLSCPVCRARFRGSHSCPRCGTDLTPLMALAGRAFALRQSAAEALRNGLFAQARALARQAHALHATARGRQLLAIASLLAGARGGGEIPMWGH